MSIARSLSLYRGGGVAWLSRYRGDLWDRNDRVPGLKARLLVALEARRIEIEAGSPWPPARTDELERVIELLNRLKWEHMA